MGWIVGGVLALLLFTCMTTTVVGWFLINGRSPQADRTTLRPAPAAVNAPVQQAAQSAPPPQIVIATPEGGLDYESATLINIYEQVNPSVVNVSNFTRGSSLDNLPGNFHDDDLLQLGSGSGFVWDAEGHLATNYHVIEDADQVQVTFNDGTVALAEVVGSDPSSDLAVLKINPDGYTLLPVRRGKLDDVRVGMRVAAIGNPFGLEGTLTSGIVSAMGRSIPAITQFSIPNSIQTDAPINPGNSGGPLLNERGEVIGVNAQIRSETGVNSGIGFAIPITIVERVVPALIAEGRYLHSYLGVSGTTLSPLCAEDLELPKTLRGAYVNTVLPNTPAARAGLRDGNAASNTNYIALCPTQKGGDVIIAINDQPVTAFDDILVYLETYSSPGDVVTLRVLRNEQEYLLDVTLAPRPSNREP
jgi:2-alkenal reductase